LSVCTTTPRMNVDNGVRIYKYTGEELSEVPWNNANYRPDKLLEACFVPALDNIYPDRPQSPVPTGAGPDAGSASVAAPVPVAAAAKPAGRYVPPSARKAGATSMSLAERMRREKEVNTQGAQKVDKKLASALSVTSSSRGPAAATAEPGKTTSQLKREKKKAKEAEQAKEQEEATRKAEEEKTKLAAVVTQVDPEKRARKIKKMLKQIDDLKQKAASELNEDQKSKVDSEAELVAELASLGI
jgi:translation initiation factor 2A